MAYNIPENPNRSRRSTAVRLGYVRLLDAAPLIVADHRGLFQDAGLDVSLVREAGWATIRDKLAFGELDVAQALSPMPFVMQAGIGVARTEVVTAMILNCNGNAITLSSRLRGEGVTDGDSLRRYVKKGYRIRKLVLGVVSLHSSHHFMLCRWLEKLGINPREDIIISVLPPEQMVRNLVGENIDGFCVGEPWNSIAIEEEHGWAAVTSSEIAFGYPEKVLATTERFVQYRPDEYDRLIEVLYEACGYCDDPANRSELLKILSRSEYLNCSPKTLDNAFSGKFKRGFGEVSEGDFVRFRGRGLNRPDLDRAEEVCQDLCRYLPGETIIMPSKKQLSRIYRADIFDRALSTITS